MSSLTFYGYRITIPSNVSYRHLNDLVSLNVFLDHPYQITVLEPSCPQDQDDTKDFSEHILVVLGFCPPDDLTHAMVLLHGLTDLLKSPALEGIVFADRPAFYTGHSRFDSEDSDSDSSITSFDSDTDGFSFAEESDEDIKENEGEEKEE